MKIQAYKRTVLLCAQAIFGKRFVQFQQSHQVNEGMLTHLYFVSVFQTVNIVSWAPKGKGVTNGKKKNKDKRRNPTCADASRPMYCMIWLSNKHPTMLCDRYKNTQQAQLTSILDHHVKRKRFKWLWKRVHYWDTDGRSFSHKDSTVTVWLKLSVSVATSAFRSVGKTWVNSVWNCGRKHTFGDHDARALTH